ncbi:hypothetical protein AMST5_03607 [freshwater sediment metagenome]|uniref:Uncharacterized protein n=1 Tax=freshwater sediment metagenome TaxID=556182 RepID=A0AA48REU0_9ZZZZ
MLVPRTAREDFSRGELLRLATMAGSGASAGEIAAILKTTPTGVYRLARKYGFEIAQRDEGEAVVNVAILGRHLDQVGVIAARKEIDPLNLLSDILRVAYVGAGVAAAYSLGNLCGSSTGSVPHPNPPRGRRNATIPNGDPDMQSLALSIPEGVKRLILLGDGDVDSDGEFKRETVAKLSTGKARFQRLGFEVNFCLADKGGDFNDMLLARIKRAAA